MNQVTQHNADTGETFTAVGATVADAVRNVVRAGQSSTQYRASDAAWVQVLAASLESTGTADRGFARYTLASGAMVAEERDGENLRAEVAAMLPNRLRAIVIPTVGEDFVAVLITDGSDVATVVRDESGNVWVEGITDAPTDHASVTDAVAYVLADDPERGSIDNQTAHTITMMIIGGALITWFLMGIIPALFA